MEVTDSDILNFLLKRQVIAQTPKQFRDTGRFVGRLSHVGGKELFNSLDDAIESIKNEYREILNK